MPRLSPSRTWLVLALLFAGAALLSGVTMLDGFQPNDEGLMLQAARRISSGQVPYRDFWWYYPPGQPYLLGALWKLFGPSLLTWRIVRVAADATVAVLVFALARRRAPVGLSLAAWLVAACAMAFPTGPHPFPIALALALGALLLVDRPLWAGALAGACAAWRIEFAAYLALGVACSYAFSAAPARERAMRFGRFAGAGAAVTLLLFAPVVAAAGFGRSWHLLVRYPIVDFSRYQSLPFPLHYEGAVTAERVLHFYLPLVLVVGLAGAIAAVFLRARRVDPGPIAAAVFAIGMAHYLVVRPDLFHTAPLAVMVAVLGAWALAGPWRGVPRRALLVAAGAAAAAGFVWALAEGIDRRVRNLQEHTVALHLPIADGVRARPLRARPRESSVAYGRAPVPPGKPIYVTGARADIVTSGNPFFYVAAGRDNPTRYDIAAPGVLTSAPVQREIVRDLSRTRPRVVVRWAAPVTAQPEPNRAGRSSGVRILDRYLAGDYRLARRFGYYMLLVPK
ncbi:MAG: hypothetical protein QOD53_576 [Thermoleophilaceae bacterium]|nr:hypothetical protein [Thermoleophilaceae bacterium]